MQALEAIVMPRWHCVQRGSRRDPGNDGGDDGEPTLREERRHHGGGTVRKGGRGRRIGDRVGTVAGCSTEGEARRYSYWTRNLISP